MRFIYYVEQYKLRYSAETERVAVYLNYNDSGRWPIWILF